MSKDDPILKTLEAFKMHRTPPPSKSAPNSPATSRNKWATLTAIVLSFITAQQTMTAQAPATSPETAAIQAKIAAERVAIGKAIASHDDAVLNRYWSPNLIVNGPENTIVSRAQVIGAVNRGGINYTSLKGNTELFTITNGAAILMGHDELVPAEGPMAGKHLVRRTTDIYERSGDDWPLVVRQATFVGFDATRPDASAYPDYIPPPKPETAAIQAQIDANSQAVGRAIHAMDFAALEKLWSPAVVVNSPGNRILTRDGVFTAMREDKLKYESAKTYADVFFVVNDLAIWMGHEDIVMANGPMEGKPLKRRFTDVWQKTGEGWVMIARQATYVGIDGGAVYGHPDPTLNR